MANLYEHQFTADEEWNVGFDAASDKSFRTLAYSGNLGGGTLQVKTSLSPNVVDVPVADAKLTNSKVDGNGDVIKQMTFQSSGNIKVVLSGSNTPNVWVAVI